jgi:hypothetical protein
VSVADFSKIETKKSLPTAEIVVNNVKPTFKHKMLGRCLNCDTTIEKKILTLVVSWRTTNRTLYK